MHGAMAEGPSDRLIQGPVALVNMAVSTNSIGSNSRCLDTWTFNEKMWLTIRYIVTADVSGIAT